MTPEHDTPGPDAPVLDLNIGMVRAGDDREILNRMLVIYLREIPERLQGIRNALTGGDFVALKDSAHSLKSVSAVIGALKASYFAAQLEKTAAAEDTNLCREALFELAPALMEVESRLRTIPGIA